MDNQQFSTPQNQNPDPAPASAEKNDKSKLIIILLALLLIAGVGGMYYWLNGKNSDVSAKLSSAEAKVNSLEQEVATLKADEADTEDEEQPAAPAKTSGINPDLIPGNTDTRRDDGRVIIGAVFKYTLKPTAIWVEYGTSPDKLDKSTHKIDYELGMGDSENIYADGFSIEIKNSDLQPGTTYYYRTAATINGQTERGPVASFTTQK